MSDETSTVGTQSRRALIAVLAGAALIVAGCGGSDSPTTDTAKSGGGGSTTETAKEPTESLDGLTAEQVLEKARAAALGAKSVRLVGKGTEGGSALDLDVVVIDGKGAKGRVNTGGVDVSFIAAGDTVYLKLGPEALKQFGGEAAATLVGDKYLSGPSDDPRFASVKQFTDLKGLVTQLLTPNGTPKRVDGKDVDGTATVGLKSGSDSGGTLYIASEGTPYPLLVEQGSDKGTVTFSDWDKDVTIDAPSDDESIDITKLGTP